METLPDLLLSKALDNALSLGLLLFAVWWFSRRDKQKDDTIAELHRENKSFLKEEMEKNREAINNNTVAFNALKDMIFSAERGK